MRTGSLLRNTQKVLIDPRKAKSFADVGVSETLIQALAPAVSEPTPMQRKMLAMTSSGVSVLARAVPGSGKSLAAMLALKVPEDRQRNISNLVLVSSAALAEQYKADLSAIYDSKLGPIQCLYRSGEVEKDNTQHEGLASEPHTVVATPTRILDYLSHNNSGISFGNLKTVVVDELDAFEKPDGGTVPLEILMKHVLAHHDPLMVLMGSSPKRKLLFKDLPAILKQRTATRSMLEVAESPGRPLKTAVKVFGPSGEIDPLQIATPAPGSKVSQVKLESVYLRLLAKMWDGNGIILIPRGLSVPAFETLITKKFKFTPTVAHFGDIMGLNMPGLDKLYILGWDQGTDLVKLAWTLHGDAPQIRVGLAGNEDGIERFMTNYEAYQQERAIYL